MWGIVDKGTDQVFAKDKSALKMSVLLPKIELAYPNRWFELQQVKADVKVVGQDLKDSAKKKGLGKF